MNTKAPHWIAYIQFYTNPTPPLALLPKAAIPAPVQAVIMVAIRLPDKVTYRDGVKTVREQWSHACYEYVRTDGEWIVIRNMHGELRRGMNDVEFAGIKYPNTDNKAA